MRYTSLVDCSTSDWNPLDLRRRLMAIVLFHLALFVGLAVLSDLTGAQIHVAMLLVGTITLAFLAGAVVRKKVGELATFGTVLIIIGCGLGVAITVFIISLYQ